MLDLWTQKTNIEVSKTDGSSLTTYGIVIAGFKILNKLNKARFFQGTFLLANTKVNIILEILFLTRSNGDVLFVDHEFISKSYTMAKALSTTR